MGSQGADRIDGGPGNDMLSGYTGRDRIFGGDGDDSLSASTARASLIGGRGKDSFGVPDGVPQRIARDFDPAEDQWTPTVRTFEDAGATTAVVGGSRRLVGSPVDPAGIDFGTVRG